ncbi:MAG: hypothetical protein L6R41_001980 [Letrouitia leprolyta]|nr:MAG: hypothetical protein L6R41_001980 [Letrouitia leprolyta]
MSSLTSLFKRPRSKSEKSRTPPKVVFGDLSSAYASIAQKNTPSTPNLRRAGVGNVSSGVQMSPQSEGSPSAPLLKNTSPQVIRVSHLSSDLFLPQDLDTSPSQPGPSRPCSKRDTDDGQLLERSTTIQNVSQRHAYGLVASNDGLHSVRGSHIATDESDEEQAKKPSVIEQVEWSPRSSVEVHATQKGAPIARQEIGEPPAIPLPRTPKGKEALKYGGLQESSTPTEEVSRSSESYGNTRRLLDLSIPRLARQNTQRDSFFDNLVDFAKEGQSSSSQGGSKKSFATFSIKEASGNHITRPVSQGEFQHLEQEISSHLRRESQASNAALGGGVIHVGQISFHFPQGSEADCGPGSSQTTDSSELESVVDFSLIQPALRTRSGTPPLLFGGSSHSKRDTDWETIGDSNELTSSIADCSDSPSTSPPKGFSFLNTRKILKHPAHPRYTHSWDLQQDVRSGAFVLTPQYKPSAAISFPNNNGLTSLALRNDISNYSHPTPLTKDHPHPFVAPAPKIGLSKSAGAIEDSQHTSSDGITDTTAPHSPAPYDPSAIFRTPPLPAKNPSRLLKKLVPEEQIELHRNLNPLASSEHNIFESYSSNFGQVSPSMDATKTAKGASIKHRSGQNGATSTGPKTVLGSHGLNHRRIGGRRSLIVTPPPHMLDGLTVTEAQTENQQNLAPAHPAPESCNVKNLSTSTNNLVNPFTSSSNSQGRHDASEGGHTGALSVSSYATTHDEPVPTLSAGPWPTIPNTDAFGVTRPTNICLSNLQYSSHRHARPDSITPERSEHLGPMSPRINDLVTHHPIPESHTPELDSFPHFHRDPAIKAPWTYEERTARIYLSICGLLPILLPLYISGLLDFVMRVHTGGMYRKFPAKEKRMAAGILITWLIIVAGAVPAMAILRSGWWAAG